jgi:hypothetical protein
MATDYQSCMTRAMQNFPKGISKEQRGLEFCAAAKVCSGKQPNHDSALKFCQANPPEPKVRSGKRSGLDAGAIARCLVPHLGGEMTVDKLASLISTCSGKTGGRRIKKPDTKNSFIRKCAIESATLRPVDAMKLRAACEKEWKAKLAEELNAPISAG